MKKYFTENIEIIVVDELSMLSAEFLVLMDKRLRLIYKYDQVFGGKIILLSGDYLQINVIGGTDIFSSMYNSYTNNQIMERNLFSQFSIFDMTQQIRAKYEKQKMFRCF